jgi:hypothetical protein
LEISFIKSKRKTVLLSRAQTQDLAIILQEYFSFKILPVEQKPIS